MNALSRLLPLTFLLAAGCSSTHVGPLEAPAALTGDVLDAISGGAQAERAVASKAAPAGDAEGDLARRMQGRRPGVRRVYPRPQPPRDPHGYGFDQGLPGTKRADLKQLLEARPTLPFPGRLACVELRGQREFVDAPSFGARTIEPYHFGWSVRPAEPQLLKTVRAALGLGRPVAGDEGEREDWPAVGPKAPPFSSIVSVPSLFLPAHGNLGKVRYAGARVGADAILVFARSTRFYTWNNGLANLYVPLFPLGFLLPAKEFVAVTRVEGAIVSVRTGHVFCVAQGEARIEESGSILFRDAEDTRRMIASAERKATRAMTADLASELAALEAAGRFKPRTKKAATKS